MKQKKKEPSRITLRAFQIGVRKRFDTEDKQVIDSFGEKFDLFEFLKETLEGWTGRNKGNSQDYLVDRFSDRVLGVDSDSLEIRSRIISGLVETGEFGYQTGQIDTKSRKKLSNKAADVADVLPFYFDFFVPKDKYHGILILQDFKNRSAYSVFRTNLEKAFSAKFEDFLLKIVAITSREIINKFYEEGAISKISFTLGKGPDPQIGAAQEKYSDGVTPDFNSKIVFTPKRNRNLLLRLFSEDDIKRLPALVGIEDVEFSKTEVQLKLPSGMRTIGLSQDEELSFFIDITTHENLKMNVSTGHPTLDSLRGIAKELRNDFGKKLDVL